MEAFLKLGIHYPQVRLACCQVDSTEPGVGVGLRWTIYDNGDFSIGWMNQVRFDWPSEWEGAVDDYSHRESFRVTQIDTLIGPAYQTENWSVYGGVLGSFVGGRRKYEYIMYGVPYYAVEDKLELHDDAVGGVIGGSLKITDGLHWTIEGSGMTDGWSASSGIKWVF